MARVNLIQLRRGTAATWTSTNPVLAAGEGGIETDTLKIKYGDGTTAWTSLSYLVAGNATSLSGATLSTDGSLTANSDTLIPSQKAVKTYVDSANQLGLWDDRGVFDASILNGTPLVNFPTSGGSGTAGAIRKGDIWTISVAGLVGTIQVKVGDTLRALAAAPGTTQSNWAYGAVELGYVPENAANKDAASGYAGLTAGSLLKTAEFPAFTGDVTTSAGGVATTIASHAVINSKFRQSAALSVVGNSTNATADVADIAGTASQVLRVDNAGTVVAFGALDVSQAAAVTGALALANGGTGATTAIGAHDAVITQSSAIASATTTDLSTATGEYVSITGTTTITAFGTVSAGATRILNFAGILTLTYNATSLIIPGSANITTAAGDIAVVRSLGSGNWVVQAYIPRGLIPGNAYKLQNPRLLNGSSFDGSANVTIDVDGGSP
jgi:hypothetical protein